MKEKSCKTNGYESPRMEIIEMKPQMVLCSSALQGNSTEAVTTGYFSFP